MDRLFLSIMIPETVICRDAHSSFKFTLYVIHFTAVYPCGPGGALEPRAGVVKRRFRSVFPGFQPDTKCVLKNLFKPLLSRLTIINIKFPTLFHRLLNNEIHEN